MSTLRISNIEAKSVPASATIDEKVKITNSSGDTLVFLDGKTSGITTVGINTTDGNITFDANSNVVVTGIITATRFSGQITPTSLEIGSNIKLGNAGVITATSFVGSGANLTSLPSQVSIASAGNDRIVTSSGGTNLNCESSLQFDGTNLFMASELRHLGDPDTSISFPSDDTIDLAVAGNSRMRITSGGKVGFHAASPVTRFQVGSHTFSGGYGMYNDDRVGMANHGSLTGLMLASTYNDSNHPEYGLVFVQGPTTSSYNVWSISPDGPAKGNSLNLHYGAQDTNIHSPSKRKFEFDGDGDFSIVDGNVKVASGHGIDFSATGDAGGMTSELLDDYEEGSWTPALQFDVYGSGLSYGTRAGTYTKIGRKVTVIYYMVISSGVSSSDYFARLTLPFTGASVGHQDCRVRQWNNGYSDWFLSMGGGGPVFFHTNGAGSGANYARGDDVNGYALAGEYTYFI